MDILTIMARRETARIITMEWCGRSQSLSKTFRILCLRPHYYQDRISYVKSKRPLDNFCEADKLEAQWRVLRRGFRGLWFVGLMIGSVGKSTGRIAGIIDCQSQRLVMDNERSGRRGML